MKLSDEESNELLSKMFATEPVEKPLAMFARYPQSAAPIAERVVRQHLRHPTHKAAVLSLINQVATAEDRIAAWRERCEVLEVVAAALYLGHDDAKEQMDMYKAVYINQPTERPKR